MKNKLITLLITTILLFSSCITTNQPNENIFQDDTFSAVVTYGTPYYNDKGLIVYYRYNNHYYYPYYRNRTYVLHKYRQPIRQKHSIRYKPLPRDFYKKNNHYQRHTKHYNQRKRHKKR